MVIESVKSYCISKIKAKHYIMEMSITLHTDRLRDRRYE